MFSGFFCENRRNQKLEKNSRQNVKGQNENPQSANFSTKYLVKTEGVEKIR